jgi:hypothetical protein
MLLGTHTYFVGELHKGSFFRLFRAVQQPAKEFSYPPFVNDLLLTKVLLF